MTYGFSTLGCPMASLGEAAAIARRFDLSHLEIRAINGSVDLLGQNLNPADLNGLPVSVLGSSLCLCGNEAAWKRAADWFDLAEVLGARWLRVFDATSVSTVPMSQAWDQVRKYTSLLERLARGRTVRPIVETHSVLLSADVLCDWLHEVNGTGVGLLWDVHHTWVRDPDGIDDILRRCGWAVRHLHIKDSVSERGRRVYSKPGTGDFPWPSIRQSLMDAGMTVTCSLEWEKLWHEDLAPLETALAAAQTVGWFAPGTKS